VRTDELDYDLPAAAIAREPAEPRDAARLLVATGGSVRHQHVADLPQHVRPGDVVVLNDTRVLPARVSIRRATGGAGEVLLLDEHGDGWWEALVRPSRKLRPGDLVTAVRVGAEGAAREPGRDPLAGRGGIDPERATGEGTGASTEPGRDPLAGRGGIDPERATGELAFEVGEDLGEGRRLVRPLHDGTLIDALVQWGSVPLPPYLGDVDLADPERYQTVYAERPASAAAPTAGLHLTPALIEGIQAAGARIVHVELVVGLGTFRPIATDTVEAHHMHHERYRVPAESWAAIEAARRVLAVGTTSVRAIESAAATGELEGSTDLFITPGFHWQATDLLMTNFHLPRSSLLAMVQAFCGPRWRELYGAALDAGYRFLSFGDAMLLDRTGATE